MKLYLIYNKSSINKRNYLFHVCIATRKEPRRRNLSFPGSRTPFKRCIRSNRRNRIRREIHRNWISPEITESGLVRGVPWKALVTAGEEERKKRERRNCVGNVYQSLSRRPIASGGQTALEVSAADRDWLPAKEKHGA